MPPRHQIDLQYLAVQGITSDKAPALITSGTSAPGEEQKIKSEIPPKNAELEVIVKVHKSMSGLILLFLLTERMELLQKVKGTINDGRY
jgi:hypothetical protein